MATEHSTVSLCVSDEVDQSEALEGCALRTTDPPEEDMYWRMVQSHTGSGSAVNLRDCAQLQAAVDPLCAFSAAPVRNFTQGALVEMNWNASCQFEFRLKCTLCVCASCWHCYIQKVG